MSLPGSMASRLYTVFSSAYNNEEHDKTNGTGEPMEASNDSTEQTDPQDDELQVPTSEQVLSDPYEHLPGNGVASDDRPTKHKPSGCVGAYLRAVHKTTSRLASKVKDERRARFDALSLGDQHHLSMEFIEACSSDDGLETVIDLVQKRKTIDVDNFYVGPDGSETCALHTAALHGATRVLDFLCRGLDERDPSQDGGLADVNLRDGNGWTALHFSAGANAAGSVQVLARHGADLLVEANNGYTPFHWSQRLSNHGVAQELERLGADQRFVELGWLRREPFSALANRFFSMIPTH